MAFIGDWGRWRCHRLLLHHHRVMRELPPPACQGDAAERAANRALPDPLRIITARIEHAGVPLLVHHKIAALRRVGSSQLLAGANGDRGARADGPLAPALSRDGDCRPTEERWGCGDLSATATQIVSWVGETRCCSGLDYLVVSHFSCDPFAFFVHVALHRLPLPRLIVEASGACEMRGAGVKGWEVKSEGKR